MGKYTIPRSARLLWQSAVDDVIVTKLKKVAITRKDGVHMGSPKAIKTISNRLDMHDEII